MRASPMFPRLFALLAGVLLLAGPGWGYGYTADEDPLLASFRSALQAVRAGDWQQAAQALEDSRWQLDELLDDFSLDLAPTLNEARDTQDARGFASAFANLVYLATLQKFLWNNKEELADFDAGRARLVSARAYYEEVLAGNVQSRDAATGTELHDELLALFEDARRSLGSPGLFGVGAEASDPAAFKAASQAIAERLKRCFPSFVHPDS